MTTSTPTLADRLAPYTAAEIEWAISTDPLLRQQWELISESGIANFRPRPDRPELYDQQWSFVYDRVPMAFMVGGNAAGTTVCSAFKTARFLLELQPPPRKNTPFWIISNTYDQTCGVCWSEKLHGMQFIPDCEVQWDKVRWLDKASGWPMRVPLKPWPTDKGGHPNRNWMIEFKSYEQGRTALQARSIGGFWFSEQFPLELLVEVLRGTREYNYPGGCMAEFTPIDPTLCLWIERIQDKPPPGWKFYRCNTECNRPNLAEGWIEEFFAAVPDEMRETRMTGELASFEGVIYESFNKAIHVTGDEAFEFPNSAIHYRGLDWGFSAEHCFFCVWGYKDATGRWFIYDEYQNGQSSKTADDHAEVVYERSQLWEWPKPGVQDSRYRDTFADPSRPDCLTTFQRHGIVTSMACNNVFEGIDHVRTLFKVHPKHGPQIVIHERCVNLIEQLRKYRWLRGKRPEDNPGLLNPQAPVVGPMKRDDHGPDALRYLLFSESRSAGRTITSMTYDEYKNRKSVRVKLGMDDGRVARGGESGRVDEIHRLPVDGGGGFAGNGHGANGDGNGNSNGNGNGHSQPWRRSLRR